ncbi:MAG: alpha/beta hydrolase [Pseudomonadota bacterium]
MPLLRVAVRGNAPRAHKTGAHIAPVLRHRLTQGGPIVILVHGYKFDPAHAGHDPHNHIFGEAAKSTFKAVSWPRQLGFNTGRPGEGLCIGFGWPARGWFGDVCEKALAAGEALAALISEIRGLAPERPVHLLAHSLGARVALAATALLRSGDLGRVILLSGAEFQSNARDALYGPAGRAAEWFNITSRENDVFDMLFEKFARAPDAEARAGIGLGLGKAMPNWVDIQIDHPDTARFLSSLGFPLAEERRRVCHWSTYNRDGVMRFYAGLIRSPESLPLAALRIRVAAQEPRFTQLLSMPALPPLFPFGMRRTL